MPARDRPLSPHLEVYRPQLTSVLSITHRMTGVALALGTLLPVDDQNVTIRIRTH